MAGSIETKAISALKLELKLELAGAELGNNSECKFQSLKFQDFCQKFYGREGGQHDQHCVKNKFVKNRVGGKGSTSIWKISLNILGFYVTPQSG